ncbi:hypothetical protein [Amaricoccus solimangrovi]|uniref:Asparagine synthetase domain-containing protein n=1 Tax=Amaricoccus solimangrovi TaxID=2589815 RepID=A0A501WGS8_9RHOB|nr:hypothetical protein [Amaricoccus solimangrovi]TPE48789.1 hypothetical protein FJM51_16370 [Amaricoccus solimangrovi]
MNSHSLFVGDGDLAAAPETAARAPAASGPDAPAGQRQTAPADARGSRDRDPRLYRFGFVALHREDFPPEGEAQSLPRHLGWRRRLMGPIALWTHPETTLRVVGTGGVRFVFLGEVIPETDPALGDPFSPERLAAVVEGGDPALYDFLDTLAGRFALMVVEEERVRVFHDPMGARSVFYWSEGPFAVASHARLLARCVGAPPDPVIHALRRDPRFRRRKTKCLPGDLTLALGVQALTPNNGFDSATRSTARYWPRQPRRPGTLEDFHRALEHSMAALGRYAGAGHRPLIGATDGVDSRLLIAAFLKLGIRFETATWQMSKLAEPKRRIIRALARQAGEPHLETRATQADDRTRAVARSNGGGYKPVYQSTFDMRGAYGDRPEMLFIRGHGAEVMRGFFNIWPTRMKAPTAAEMARLYWSPAGNEVPPDLPEMFEGYIRRANWAAVAEMGFDPNDIFYWEHRMGMWSAGLNNEFDVAMRSVPGFNSRQLFAAALGLPPETRLTKKLFLDAVERFEPRLSGIPLGKMVAAPEARQAAAASSGREGVLASIRRATAGARKAARRGARTGRRVPT